MTVFLQSKITNAHNIFSKILFKSLTIFVRTGNIDRFQKLFMHMRVPWWWTN